MARSIKVCTLCGQELPLTMFPTNRGMADGHLGKCFACWELFTSDRQRKLVMVERKRAKKEEAEPAPKPKKRRMANEEARQRKNARERARYHKLKAINPDYIKERNAKAQARVQLRRMNETEEERAQRLAVMRDYYARNAEKWREYAKKHREKLRNSK